MKGLAIYTVVFFVFVIVGLISSFDMVGAIGAVLFLPILIFGIMYLVKKKNYCGQCGSKI